VCRLDPWPDALVATFDAIEADPTVYATMNGPSEFTVIGPLRQWTIADRLGEIDVPLLLISGEHDEVRPDVVKVVDDNVPDSEWVPVRGLQPHPASRGARPLSAGRRGVPRAHGGARGLTAGPCPGATVRAMAANEKPQVDVPSDQPPSYQLELEDIVEGDGDEAVAGKIVEVHYVGVSWKNGKQFDASWDRGDTFKFGLGKGQVIRGWDEGVAGMKVGGRRRITIPPDMAYGKRGAGGVIGPTRRSSSSWT
jgi:peptidylprolyl isomerase